MSIHVQDCKYYDFPKIIKDGTSELETLEVFFESHCKNFKNDRVLSGTTDYFCNDTKKQIDFLKFRIEYLDMAQKMCKIYENKNKNNPK